MKKIALWLVSCIVCIATVFALASCGENNSSGNGSGQVKKAKKVGTMEELVVEKDENFKLLKLDDIDFPDGMLNTGLGLFIWDNTKKGWTRTNTAEGKAAFRKDKSTMIFAHGMGGNASLDRPEYYYENGYNPVTFRWGAFSDEKSEKWEDIADNIWYRGTKRWKRADGSFEEKDLVNATVAEIYAAFYCDLLEAFPDYSGAETIIFGHSYGGMLTGAMMSLLTSMYQKGHLPAYMLPDKINFLDPYFSRADIQAIPWLTEDEMPEAGNVNEAIYQGALACKKLGIAVGLVRTSKPVCLPTTMNHMGMDLTESYWNFCNNIVYLHLNDNWKDQFTPDFINDIHGYGWSWFDEYNTDDHFVIMDQSATVDEEAYCFYMPYEKMFAKAGIKYDLDANWTLTNITDDIVTSFYCTYSPYPSDWNPPEGYDPEEDGWPTGVNDCTVNESEQNLAAYEEGKAKIAGFAYVDKNDNGKMDERVKDHFAGVLVEIKDASGKVIYSEFTDINGYYEVATDVAGEYTVSFTAPKGYTVSAEEAKVTISDTHRQVAINNVIVAGK